jgi:protein-S-isoprenylcysteine O-methyltransferase Ste14
MSPVPAPPYLWVTGALWALLLLYWFATSFQRRSTVRREPRWQWLARITPLVAAYALFFRDPGRADWLGRRFVPASPWIAAAGVIVTAAGVALAIWARRHLGLNWSATISIRAGHELIRTGPYHAARHPIYGGFLLATAGTALTLGEVRGLLTFGIVLLLFTVKARKEDAWLAREFGEDFATHRRRTGMFLPRPFARRG